VASVRFGDDGSMRGGEHAPSEDRAGPFPDLERVAQRLETLWQVARGPGGGADRPAFSAAEAEAMLIVAGWAREARLEPGIDRHGNLWALPRAWDGPLVSTGSHVDTVPDGGRYDGALGTVLGLELAHELRSAATAGARPALLVCAAEEAPRFGAGTIGSRLLAGTLKEAALAGLRDARGIDAATARAHWRADLAELPEIEAPIRRVRAHAEIHIAQRRALRELGVVTRVASPLRLEIELTGAAGHSGEVSMEDRRDALAAAAEVMLAIERGARLEPPETVATVGALTLEPGALSVIPARVVLALDVRAIDAESLHRLEHAIRSEVAAIAARRRVDAAVRLVRGGEPVTLDPRLADSALGAARRLGISARETWSGAGHDAQHLATLIPTLLLFVPLQGGESHTPFEDADPEDVAHAVLLACEVLRTSRLDTGSRV
jgi:hydantoinase/carbamoylase family amidase